MFNYNTPLRYEITDWHQLPQCKSNTDKRLHLHVTDFIHTSDIVGTRISLEHEIYGVLFTYVVDANGCMIAPVCGVDLELSTETILIQLAKFGFLITYKPAEHLPGNQIQYLMTLHHLKFDKIRLLAVWDAPRGVKEFIPYVVAFKVEQLPGWLQSSYSPSVSEFNQAINSGYAINITAISKDEHFSWDWLYNWVADINDILKENSQ